MATSRVHGEGRESTRASNGGGNEALNTQPPTTDTSREGGATSFDQRPTLANLPIAASFTNVGQVIQISGDNNTVVMAGNRFHVMQQNQALHQHHHHHQESRGGSGGFNDSHTASPHSGRPYCSPSQPAGHHCISSHQTTSQSTSVIYAPGPPERIELVTLTTQLTRTVGSEWKLLAAPLNIDDADVNSIDYEQKTLKLKINELLKIWVDRDEQNDRTRLAQLLTSLDGYNLVRACQESLRKL